jgi:hypothetical protein
LSSVQFLAVISTQPAATHDEHYCPRHQQQQELFVTRRSIRLAAILGVATTLAGGSLAAASQLTGPAAAPQKAAAKHI